MSQLKRVVMYTDGACIQNPGPGGYAVVLLYGPHRKELSDGYRFTTNNRMELMAAIAGLEALREVCQVTLYSDSEYLVKGMEEGWARNWQAHGWRRGGKKSASNPDLWSRLLHLCDDHRVDFKWVRGHAANAENERCDQLALNAAQRADLPADEGYERLKSVDLTAIRGTGELGTP